MKKLNILSALLFTFALFLNSATAENHPEDDKPLFSYKQAKAINYEEAMRLVEYPEIGKNLAIEGTVKVRVYVSAEGTVEKYTIMEGSDTRLASAVDNAVKSLEFEPTVVINNTTGDAEAVPSWVVIPFNFSLNF
ncbi:energy transducer TonB [Flammeovirga sp. MY04]|uniref:energy transducer TonB n=1 Tax=Flammeovirga sp. MY04 TaxID=1191459 RepID=UPI00080640A1|nr:energy transducer TonB [Flammeovirga sp. MY04]ANQ49167.1 energy transducer TonB [Flammeovirga sp. MY04]